MRATPVAIGAAAPGSVREVPSVMVIEGTTAAGVFVAASLVLLLAYLNLLNAQLDADPFQSPATSEHRLRRAVAVVVAPLLVTFSAIVLYRSLRVLEIL